MKERQDTAKRVVIILGIVQIIALAYFLHDYIMTPIAERGELYLILIALSLLLLVRLYTLLLPKNPHRRFRSPPARKTVRESRHGLSVGDIVYVKHLNMNAKIEHINDDDTYTIRTLLNQTYTVDIDMIEIRRHQNRD